MLCSDRGSSFIRGVVRSVNEYLGVAQAFGNSCHPESQGYLEARHKPANNVFAAYCRQYPGQWLRWLKLAQLAAMKRTPRADRCGKSPCEIVAGLTPPRGPSTSCLPSTNTLSADPNSYVAMLHTSLERSENELPVRAGPFHTPVNVR